MLLSRRQDGQFNSAPGRLFVFLRCSNRFLNFVVIKFVFVEAREVAMIFEIRSHDSHRQIQ